MTDTELHDLILGDATALALAKAGQDAACCARCIEIAPPTLTPTLVGELGIIAAYDNPVDAETVLQTIETVAGGNPIVARVLKWIQPSAPGIDFGDVRVRALLTTATEAGGIGLTEQQAAPLLQKAELPAVIATNDVSRVLSPRRENGMVGVDNWLEVE